MTSYGVDNTDLNQEADHTFVPADETAGTGDSAFANKDTVDTNAASTEGDSEAVANSAPVGPEVVSADSVQPSDNTEAPAAFDGTSSYEDRLQAQADEDEVRAKNEAESKDVAAAQHAEDLRFANENPYAPVARAANPDVGGESFN